MEIETQYLRMYLFNADSDFHAVVRFGCEGFGYFIYQRLVLCIRN